MKFRGETRGRACTMCYNGTQRDGHFKSSVRQARKKKDEVAAHN